MPDHADSNAVERLDRNALLARVAHDRGLLAALIALYQQEAPALAEKVRNAVRSGDPLTLRNAAHAFKGVVANFAQGPTYQAAFRLEEMGRQGELTGVESALAELESAIPRLDAALNRLAQELR
jgi:HPt (histidine-containing phosphotransfer) domain-containing protein